MSALPGQRFAFPVTRVTRRRITATPAACCGVKEKALLVWQRISRESARHFSAGSSTSCATPVADQALIAKTPSAGLFRRHQPVSCVHLKGHLRICCDCAQLAPLPRAVEIQIQFLSLHLPPKIERNDIHSLLVLQADSANPAMFQDRPNLLPLSQLALGCAASLIPPQFPLWPNYTRRLLPVQWDMIALFPICRV